MVGGGLVVGNDDEIYNLLLLLGRGTGEKDFLPRYNKRPKFRDQDCLTREKQVRFSQLLLHLLRYAQLPPTVIIKDRSIRRYSHHPFGTNPNMAKLFIKPLPPGPHKPPHVTVSFSPSPAIPAWPVL